MGEAKKRKAEIEELKAKGPKEKKRRKLKLKEVREYKVPHFKNAAARLKVKDVLDEHNIRSSGELSALLNSKEVPATLVNPIIIKVFNAAVQEKPPRDVKKAEPLVLVTGRKLTDAEFFSHALAMAQINPSGFRQPSDKAKNFNSTSLIEQLSERMGISPDSGQKRSERGQKKLEARQESNALIVLDQLIERWPARAEEAKHDERKVNWFVGKVYEATSWATDREWLTNLVKERVKEDGLDYKYLHATKRRRYRTYEAAADELFGRAA